MQSLVEVYMLWRCNALWSCVRSAHFGAHVIAALLPGQMTILSDRILLRTFGRVSKSLYDMLSSSRAFKFFAERGIVEMKLPDRFRVFNSVSVPAVMLHRH
jgi:hypothetical protein